MNDRRKFNSYMDSMEPYDYRTISFHMNCSREVQKTHFVNPHPFIPDDPDAKFGRCKEIFTLQSTGLQERMRKTGIKKAVIALSGGLDSTLALAVTVEAMRSLKSP
jgi:NAD+ synthase (glutamine-hydrolysing)